MVTRKVILTAIALCCRDGREVVNAYNKECRLIGMLLCNSRIGGALKRQLYLSLPPSAGQYRRKGIECLSRNGQIVPFDFNWES